MIDRDFFDLIKRMAVMAEYREWDNSMHLERIRRYCYTLATQAGIPSQDAEMIAYACQLHDVGKLSLPDEIVSKAGRYKEKEWRIVESHTTVGANLLKGSSNPVIQIGEIVALGHHERWDGSGYPRRLKGEAIPVEARLCALADVYDALTTRRIYKDVTPEDEAFQLVRKAGGTLFDPNLIEAFEKSGGEFKKIRKEFSN